MTRLGRPRTFEREEALKSAMELFWSRGYDGVSLTDLQKAMGDITAPSFYAAFGSKEKLFREAVDLYIKTRQIPIKRALAEEVTARASIEKFLLTTAEFFSQPNKPHGCLVVLGAINCTNTSLQELLRDRRASGERLILQILRQGVAKGDLPTTVELKALAAFYSTVMNGLAIKARDGASRKELKNIVSSAMAAWDKQLSEVGATR